MSMCITSEEVQCQGRQIIESHNATTLLLLDTKGEFVQFSLSLTNLQKVTHMSVNLARCKGSSVHRNLLIVSDVRFCSHSKPPLTIILDQSNKAGPTLVV